MVETIIKLENVSKSYRSIKAVDNVNLSIKSGEIVGLIGPNGAGKTTVIKMIALLTFPDEGKIFIQNKNGIMQNILEESEGVISQGFLVDIPHFYNMTASQLLTYFGKIQEYPEKLIPERIHNLLKKFNLLEWKHRKVGKFSKGMIQKLGIIQAVFHKPEFIILDEPQTGLDPKARIEVRNFIRELQEKGKTILISSHLLYEITELCDKIALINKGKIIAFDGIEKLEDKMKLKELECKLAKPIPKNHQNKIMLNLKDSLKPYLMEKMINLEQKINPITYDTNNQILRIKFKGDKMAKNKILNILTSEFKEELTLTSFSESNTSRLERIYNQLVLE